MVPLRKDQSVLYREIEHKIISSTAAGGDTLMENVETGERTTHKTWNLLNDYVAGELLTCFDRSPGAPGSSTKKRKPARMDGMSAAARTETRRRIDYLVKLEARGGFGCKRVTLRRHLSEIALLRGEPRPPHESTVFRWRRKYLRAQNDVRAIFARFDNQGGKGKGRLDAEVERILFECIDRIVLGQKTFSAEEVRDAVVAAIALRNAQHPQSDQLSVPGLRTVQRRIAGLWAYELAVAKFGKREADRRHSPMKGSRLVSRILEIVEIDHSPIDALVTEGDRQEATARPTITVVLERKSRCLLGYHLSSAGHGVTAVFEAIRHALLPKTYLSTKYADLQLEWPCYGWPERIVMDNGLEFHADAVADALHALNILAEFARSREPNDKACVERFLRTLNYGLIHKLPGTTLAKVHQRVGFKSEEEVALTLEELDRIIHVWVCDVYHKRPHAGLDGRTPIDVWLEGAAANPPQLKLNKHDLDIELGEIASSAVQHYGIDLNTFVYRSDRLLTLRRMLPQGQKVAVKWSKSDVGYVWVWDEIQTQYMKVPNTDEEYNGLTLEQAKAARKAKSAGAADYQPVRSSAGVLIREMVDDALADKKLKSRKRGSRLGNRSSKLSREDVGAVLGPMADEDVDDGDELPVDEIRDLGIELEVEMADEH